MRRLAGLITVAMGLSVATAGLAQQTASPPPAKPKLICKRSAETGSLIPTRKECRTREEWDRLAEAARSNAEYENQRNASRSGGT